jgi:hypothetical protein
MIVPIFATGLSRDALAFDDAEQAANQITALHFSLMCRILLSHIYDADTTIKR